MAHTPPPPETPYAAPSEPRFAVAPRLRPTIATRRLVLRPLTDDDADDVAATIGDAAVARMLARVPHPYSRDNALSFIRFAGRGAVAGRSLISAITRDRRLIGVVSIDGIPGRNRLGYWLGREHWRRGYGAEAVTAIVAYAIGVLGVRQIRAGLFVDNGPSLRLLAKLGFRVIGRRSGVSLARDDQAVDFVATVLSRRRFAAAGR